MTDLVVLPDPTGIGSYSSGVDPETVYFYREQCQVLRHLEDLKDSEVRQAVQLRFLNPVPLTHKQIGQRLQPPRSAGQCRHLIRRGLAILGRQVWPAVTGAEHPSVVAHRRHLCLWYAEDARRAEDARKLRVEEERQVASRSRRLEALEYAYGVPWWYVRPVVEAWLKRKLPSDDLRKQQGWWFYEFSGGGRKFAVRFIGDFEQTSEEASRVANEYGGWCSLLGTSLIDKRALPYVRYCP